MTTDRNLMETIMPPRLLTHDRIHLHAGFPKWLHRHEHWELIVVLAGSYTARIEGSDQRHDHPSILVYPPGVAHEPRIPAPPDSLIACLGWTWPEGPAVDQAFVLNDSQGRILALQGWIADLRRTGDGDAAITGLLTALGDAIVRQVRGRDSGSLDPSAAGHTHIRDTPQAQLGITVLTRLAGMSAPHLRRLFKRRYGMSPMAYVRQVRTERAIALLAETDLPNEAVATAIVIHSDNYFEQFIKRQTGRTPGAWRRGSGPNRS